MSDENFLCRLFMWVVQSRFLSMLIPSALMLLTDDILVTPAFNSILASFNSFFLVKSISSSVFNLQELPLNEKS